MRYPSGDVRNHNSDQRETMTSATFLPLNIAILTVSDTRTTKDDRSGAYLQGAATAAGHNVVHTEIIPDTKQLLISRFTSLAAQENIDVIISTGGTGLTARDQTPEAVEAVIDKAIPGFGELFRWQSYGKIGTSTIQSRACAGVINKTFIFALPGSTSACRDGWEGILLSQLDIRHKPCNFAELIPRLGSTNAQRKGGL